MLTFQVLRVLTTTRLMISRSKVDLAKCGRIPVSDRKKPDCLSHFEKISLSLARLAAQAKILHLELSPLPKIRTPISQFYALFLHENQ